MESSLFAQQPPSNITNILLAKFLTGQNSRQACSSVVEPISFSTEDSRDESFPTLPHMSPLRNSIGVFRYYGDENVDDANNDIDCLFLNIIDERTARVSSPISKSYQPTASISTISKPSCELEFGSPNRIAVMPKLRRSDCCDQKQLNQGDGKGSHYPFYEHFLQKLGLYDAAILVCTPPTEAIVIDLLARNLLSACRSLGSLGAGQLGKGYERGRILVVTTKRRVDMWADCVRDIPQTRLHVYTNSLQERRRHGTAPLTRVDIVVTTYDVLRSKEVCIPEETSKDDAIDDLTHRLRNLDTTCIDEFADLTSPQQWMTTRAGDDNKIMLSFLHLIHWEALVLDDAEGVTGLGPQGAKGRAVREVKRHRSVGFIRDEVNNVSKQKCYSHSSIHVTDIKSALGINPAIATASVTVHCNQPREK